MIDFSAEQARLEKELARVDADIARIDTKQAQVQSLWVAISIAVFVITLAVVRDVRVFERYRYTVAFLGVAALLVPLAPGIGQTINGKYELTARAGEGGNNLYSPTPLRRSITTSHVSRATMSVSAPTIHHMAAF